MKIEHKVAVVTGATGGIGLATAKMLADNYIKGLAIVDLSPRCEEVAKEINGQSDKRIAIPFQGDVTSVEFRKSVFKSMADQFGPVQICIPAAGIISDALAVKLNKETAQVELYPESEFNRTLQVNLVHPTYWAMETIAAIAQHRHENGLKKWQSNEDIQGSIVLIGSVSSRGNRGQVAYAAVKSGLIGVSATLNLEGLFHGVQSKIIHPGFVDTQMVDAIDADYFENNLKPLIGLGRKIQPDEIASIIRSMIENPVMSGQIWADASMAPFS